jgi:hypothetical protein
VFTARYVLLTVYLCVLCGSENKQQLFHCTTLTDWACVVLSSSMGSVIHPSSRGCVVHPSSRGSVIHPSSRGCVVLPSSRDCVVHPSSRGCVVHLSSLAPQSSSTLKVTSLGNSETPVTRLHCITSSPEDLSCDVAPSCVWLWLL